MTAIKAAPGIYLVQEIKEDTQVVTGSKPDRRIIRGKIIDIGENRDHDQGGKLAATFHVGDIIWFLNYQENYDWFEVKDKDGKYQKYYCVIFNDVRARQL